MSRSVCHVFIVLFSLSFVVYQLAGKDYPQSDDVSPAGCLVWGPGLNPVFVVPVRYFFIQLVNKSGNNITSTVGPSPFTVQISSESVSRVRIQVQQLDRNDGSYIVRFKLYESYSDLKISIIYKNAHVGSSPYELKGYNYHERCDCPTNINKWLKSMQCPKSYTQIKRDLAPFKNINFPEVIKKIWPSPEMKRSRSICHYTIKDNKIYRRTFGQHVGFKMFSDAVLLSLTRKVVLPDVEFLVNLGDWPLEFRSNNQNPMPIFSWCGSDETYDIVMPTYDITESTLETMGRVTLDLLSVQGSSEPVWEEKKPHAFWRGRDSRIERLQLVKMSMEDPELIDAKLTNMFFFEHDKAEHGELVKASSFFDFFKYKYQLNIDGTVAAYRFPYLLGGGALVFKQDSNYYEYFYKSLKPNVHYIPFKRDLSDLKEKIQWAKENDDKAKEIAENGRKFVQENLMAEDIFCYHVILFKEYSKHLAVPPMVYEDMELVEQPPDHYKGKCTCHHKKKGKDEL